MKEPTPIFFNDTMWSIYFIESINKFRSLPYNKQTEREYIEMCRELKDQFILNRKKQ